MPLKYNGVFGFLVPTLISAFLTLGILTLQFSYQGVITSIFAGYFLFSFLLIVTTLGLRFYSPEPPTDEGKKLATQNFQLSILVSLILIIILPFFSQQIGGFLGVGTTPITYSGSCYIQSIYTTSVKYHRTSIEYFLILENNQRISISKAIFDNLGGVVYKTRGNSTGTRSGNTPCSKDIYIKYFPYSKKILEIDMSGNHNEA